MMQVKLTPPAAIVPFERQSTKVTRHLERSQVLDYRYLGWLMVTILHFVLLSVCGSNTFVVA
jgi:hypothetical protein